MSNSDLERAVDRLQYAITEENDRRIIFVTGSGLSRPAISSTAQMIGHMLGELGGGAASLRQTIEASSPEDGYRAAARELDLRRGPRGMSRALSSAVAEAYVGPRAEEMASDFSVQSWKVPDSQRLFGEVISEIPSQQRGPIFTTNFDPLTEVSLHNCHVHATPLAAPANVALPLDSVIGSLPVVHLHGYWCETATVNTAAQLDTPRPEIEGMLRAQLQHSLVVILGYGGWNDSFMRTLSTMVSDGSTGMLECEILWIAHGSDSSADHNPLISRMRGSVGVNFYWGIDVADLLRGVLGEIRGRRRDDQFSAPGWSAVPLRSDVGDPGQGDIIEFVEGVQPTWSVAKKLPALLVTESAISACSPGAGGDRLVALTGPTGEGKSLALRQVGLALANPGRVVLVRDPGVSIISSELISHLRANFDVSYLLVDEADLLLSGILRELDPDPSGGRIVFVVAMHSQYSSRLPVNGSSKARLVRRLDYGSIDMDDCVRIASSWLDCDVLPDTYSDKSAEEIAEMIVDAGISARGNSLFGAVLHLWAGEGLQGRVRDLLDRLDSLVLRDRTMKFLLGAVAYVQCAWDLEESQMKGLTILGLGRLCGLRSEDVVPLVVTPLGREVGLSQVGNRVYVRHPAIALAIRKEFEEAGDSFDLIEELSRVGALMRLDDNVEPNDSAPLYGLWSRLEGEEAKRAVRGLVSASRSFLEARVSLIACYRRAGAIEFASKFASRVAAHLAEFEDLRISERGFWVEYGVVEWRNGHSDTGLGLVARSLSDLHGSRIDLDQLHYGLINTARIGLQIGHRRVASGVHVAAAAKRILSVIPRGEDGGIGMDEMPVSSESSAALVDSFRRATWEFSGDAQGNWRFNELLRAVQRQRGRMNSK